MIPGYFEVSICLNSKSTGMIVSKTKLRVLAITIGLIFFYFGILKLFPNASPAESIGTNTVSMLSLNLLSNKVCIYSLAILELLIALSLITGKFFKWGVVIGIGHLLFTFTPAIFFPDQVFNDPFFTPTLLGQYIFKNVILISALWVLYPVSDKSSDVEVFQGEFQLNN